MKLDRLLTIVMLLVNRRMIQAKELAEMFEVSVRTIYRDVEAINQAGIPVVTYQGINGGLSIAESYKVDRNVFSSDDIVTIISALKNANTSLSEGQFISALEKVRGLIPQAKIGEVEDQSQFVIVDLSPWGDNGEQRNKLTALKEAIEARQVVSFDYTNTKGESITRSVEPMTLVLKTDTWYLYGYCRVKNDFRMFRLSRIKHISVTGECFVRQAINLHELPWERQWYGGSNVIELVLKFAPRLRVQIEERFGADNVVEMADGYWRVNLKLPEDDWVYGMILSYGGDVEVLEPEKIRGIIGSRAGEIGRIYGGKGE